MASAIGGQKTRCSPPPCQSRQVRGSSAKNSKLNGTCSKNTIEACASVGRSRIGYVRNASRPRSLSHRMGRVIEILSVIVFDRCYVRSVSFSHGSDPGADQSHAPKGLIEPFLAFDRFTIRKPSRRQARGERVSLFRISSSLLFYPRDLPTMESQTSNSSRRLNYPGRKSKRVLGKSAERRCIWETAQEKGHESTDAEIDIQML